MFLKTEIVLIAEKLRPTCMTQFPRYILYKAGGQNFTLMSPLRYWPMRKEVSSQWSHSIGLALSCSPRKFQNICLVVLCRYPFGYLVQQADHVALWQFWQRLLTARYSLCRDSTTPFAHCTAHCQVINCPLLACSNICLNYCSSSLHLVRQQPRMVMNGCSLHKGSEAQLLRESCFYYMQTRHQYRTAIQYSHNTISLLKQRCCKSSSITEKMARNGSPSSTKKINSVVWI